jgi:hypothetical protein
MSISTLPNNKLVLSAISSALPQNNVVLYRSNQLATFVGPSTPSNTIYTQVFNNPTSSMNGNIFFSTNSYSITSNFCSVIVSVNGTPIYTSPSPTLTPAGGSALPITLNIPCALIANNSNTVTFNVNFLSNTSLYNTCYVLSVLTN